MSHNQLPDGHEPARFMLGNEAIVQGFLEAGVDFAAGYPGTPSSEIIERLAARAHELTIYAEWSTNEKVASEGAAAAAFAGLHSVAAMKNAGLSVALDFLTHLSLTGIGDRNGAMVVTVCDDPDAHSSGDETDSRWLARFAYAPLLEPSSVQEARTLAAYAMDLSQRHACYVMLRGYTRLSHGSSVVETGSPDRTERTAHSDTDVCVTPYLAKPKHDLVLQKLERIREEFASSPFNEYIGPEAPELVIVASGSGVQCALEALELLDLRDRVGVLKLVTLWPFPGSILTGGLKTADTVLIAEEVDPFLESLVKETLFELGHGGKKVYGKTSGHIPPYGEITPDRVIHALCRVFDIAYESRPESYDASVAQANDALLVSRGLLWCAGCPHRASFWALGKALKGARIDAYVTGDIGCYTLDVFPEGQCRMNLLHAMGSGIGLASGLGQLGRFGHRQPVIAICGDSTFFHSSLPGLVNAVYNSSNLLQIILDNDATAMTGFQAHPGVGYNAMGGPAKQIDIETLCQALGVPVETMDPFQTRQATRRIRELVNQGEGVRVLIMKRACELLRMKREKTARLTVRVDQEKCLGAKCAVCYRAFRCPAFVQDEASGKAVIKETACPGCGACIEVCPAQAISAVEEGS